jgi:hypothetical protein
MGFYRGHQAFADMWPMAVKVVYGMRANKNLRFRNRRALEVALRQGKQHTTFTSSADPEGINISGAYQTHQELERDASVRINIDAREERVSSAASPPRSAAFARQPSPQGRPRGAPRAR